MKDFLQQVLNETRSKTDGFAGAKEQTIKLCEKGIELIDNGQTEELKSLLLAIIESADFIVTSVMENTDQAGFIPGHLKKA